MKIPKDIEVGANNVNLHTTSCQAEATVNPTTTSVNTNLAEHSLIQVKPRIEREENAKRAQNKHIQQELKDMEEQILPVNAIDIGLVFYTTKKQGWPKLAFTREDLLKGIHTGYYKWTCTSRAYDERELFHRISNQGLVLESCWNVVESDIFRKIRSGFIENRSPIASRDPRMRKLSH